ncbi:TonB-dependent receptor [Sphingomonas sp. dw_22]|uniref:TonB-dependent receptor n=1 Tax=Sphingomonas sp. dw_22 TaxID=2721175 RepID=UPI001BD4DE16|nr:TonB-dependent receptor [Sphingomonas sp. dw_22]
MERKFSQGLRAWILAGAAIGALTLSAAAHAQDAAPEAPAEADSAGLTDIVVTAEKRETNLQKTPIAISVLSGEALADRHVQSLLDLQDGAVPSLRISPTFSRNSALSVGIRGITGGDSNQPSRDSGIGMYIDGVYLGRAQGLGMALLDVERIEVLKGPQGTLFGRNSVGGAVSIVTRKPSGEFQLRQTIGVRNFDGYNAETHLDLPSFANISLKFDGMITKRDGTVKNTLQGADGFNLVDRRGAHVAALWEPSGNFNAQLDADYGYDATSTYYVQLLNRNPTPLAPLAPLVQVQPDRAGTVDIGVPEQPSVGETYGVGLHLKWHAAEGIDLRSITSYRDLKQNQYDNGIGAHAGVFQPNAQFSRYSLASMRQHQFSQEFQLVGDAARLQYVAGLYYYHEAGDDDAWSPNTMQWNATGTAATVLPSFSAGAATPFPDRASTAKADSYAAFGQATWNPAVLSNMLRLTLGGRYTHDKKSGRLYKVNGADAPYSFTFSKDHFDPQATITLDPSDDIELYGKWGTAYRAGGANSRSLTYRAYGPEKVSTFEAGLKTSFWDKRGRFNVAAYTTSYTDIQIDFIAPTAGTNRTTIETLNAPGNGTIKGVEVDASLTPLPRLTLSASYAYTDGHLPQAANPFQGNALQTVYVTYTPKNAGSGAIDYTLPLAGDTMLRAHLDANIADGYYSMAGEATSVTDSSFIVNGRLVVGGIDLTRGAKLEVSLWSRNLLNEQHVFVRSHAAYSIGGDYGIYNEPRTFGVDGTLRF